MHKTVKMKNTLYIFIDLAQKRDFAAIIRPEAQIWEHTEEMVQRYGPSGQLYP